MNKTTAGALVAGAVGSALILSVGGGAVNTNADTSRVVGGVYEKRVTQEIVTTFTLQQLEETVALNQTFVDIARKQLDEAQQALDQAVSDLNDAKAKGISESK